MFESWHNSSKIFLYNVFTVAGPTTFQVGRILRGEGGEVYVKWSTNSFFHLRACHLGCSSSGTVWQPPASLTGVFSCPRRKGSSQIRGYFRSTVAHFLASKYSRNDALLVVESPPWKEGLGCVVSPFLRDYDGVSPGSWKKVIGVY